MAPSPDERYLRTALDAARAADKREVPVAAVVVRDDAIVATATNARESLGDPTAHAEVLALRQAATVLDTWRLQDCTLYVTLEPCPMCAGATVAARISRLVFGAWNPDYGAVGSLWDIPRDRRLPHRPEVLGGVLAEECTADLQQFFQEQRSSDHK